MREHADQPERWPSSSQLHLGFVETARDLRLVLWRDEPSDRARAVEHAIEVLMLTMGVVLRAPPRRWPYENAGAAREGDVVVHPRFGELRVERVRDGSLDTVAADGARRRLAVAR